MSRTHYIIGAGGGGSLLIVALARLVGPGSIVVVDGDTLEKKNLDRQAYGLEHIGMNKAEALASIHGTGFIPKFFTFGSFSPMKEDILFSCVDNNPSRRSIMQTCDSSRCRAIIAGNETFSAEAMIYLPEWRGSERDPRSFAPEIFSGTDGDPLALSAGCTGESQNQNKQLVTANFMSAALALHLHVLWNMEAPTLDREVVDTLPNRHMSTLSRLNSLKTVKESREASTERTTNDS